MAVPVRSKTYHDSMGHARRVRTWVWRALGACGVGAIGITMLWIFFFSSVFAVTDIHVVGTTTLSDQKVTDAVQALLAQRHLYVFQPLRNIVLLDTAAITDHLMAQYPAIGVAAVTKKYPHALDVQVTERQAAGQWCRKESCQLFDRSGVRWGNILPSSGPLLLLIQDERTDDTPDPKMLTGILAVVDGLPERGLTARSITLPDAEPGGIRIKTLKGYDLLMDADGDVADQLEVLSVFLADRAKDPAFSPQYIDLRTPGRVYYK